MKRWIVSPDPIVAKYLASAAKRSKPVSPTIFVMSAKTPMGRNFMIPDVSAIIAWKKALKMSVTTTRGFSGSPVIAAPKTMQKKMIASMSPAEAAAKKLFGTMSRMRSTAESGVLSSGTSCCAAAPMSAFWPGRMRFTISRPVSAASMLDST